MYFCQIIFQLKAIPFYWVKKSFYRHLRSWGILQTRPRSCLRFKLFDCSESCKQGQCSEIVIPQKGNKAVKFSDEIPDGCSGFRLGKRGHRRDSFVPERMVDFDDNGVPFTRKCLHQDCDMSDIHVRAHPSFYSEVHQPIICKR